MNAPARFTIGAGLGLVVACSSASDQGGAPGGPERPRDASVDAWYATVDGSGPGVDAGPIARPDSAGLDAGDAADSGDEAAVVPPACSFDGGMAPPGSGFCGDGWRQATAPDGGPGEECDDGLGDAGTLRRSCSSQCEVLDELAVAQFGPDGGLANAPRTLGGGRHPIAASDTTFGVVYLEPNSVPLTLSLAAFSLKGLPTGAAIPFSAGSIAVQESNPVVASLPCDQYAIAWTDHVAQGPDELDVALRVVTAAGIIGPLTHANNASGAPQHDPDVVWTGSNLVVAWQDDTDPATQPDLRFRTFDTTLQPTAAVQTLTATQDAEADVALTAFSGGWAAAWRDDANGIETIRVRVGSDNWTVGPAFVPVAAGAKPGLGVLDGTHLLLVYAGSIANADSGASSAVVQAAVIDTTTPGPVLAVALSVPPGGPDQGAPVVVASNGATFVGWWSAASAGDPNGEELWVKSVTWTGSGLDTTSPPMTLPRWATARLGDQRTPAIAAATQDVLVAAWNDFGETIAQGEGKPDVVLETLPLPILRRRDDGGN